MRYFLILLLLLIFSCKKEKKHAIDFYYWKSNYSINEFEKQTFKQLNAKKLYTRLFDIDKNKSTPKPIAIIQNFKASSLSTEFIPVVFVTNRTFLNLSVDERKGLAKNCWKSIEKILNEAGVKTYSEIQIDCDWTASTKLDYFNFLEDLKKESNKKITCTLRLHQVKYRNTTGIPPVSKVYLMCYATSNPTEEQTQNSILDLPTLKDYLKSINDYPILFDIALPIYSWGIITNHLGQKKLINGLSKNNLPKGEFKNISTNNYQLTNDVFVNGIYLNEGFHIKIENITPQLLHDTKSFLNKKINKPYRIVYYHLDSTFITDYKLDDLK